MQAMELPIVIGGRSVYPGNSDDNYIFRFDDIEVKMPKLNKVLLNELSSIDTNPMKLLTVNEILAFLSRVGSLWQKPGYKYKKMLIESGPKLNGQSEVMLHYNIGLLLSYTAFKPLLQDTIEMELGSKAILDEWIPRYDAYIKAVPLGNLIHILSSNVPIAGIYSLIRGILTKNLNIAKLSSGDLLTLLLFVLSFQDIDPNHPITKTVSAIYWEREDTEIIDHFMNLADGLCIWGGKESVTYYKKRVKYGAEVIEYGPKIGVQIIRWDENSAKDLPIRSARDISVYEQEACMSPQVIYLEGDVDSFVEGLKQGLLKYSDLWPKPKCEIDNYAHMNYIIKANHFIGNNTVYDMTLNWLIVIKDNNADLPLDHPLGRTIYIYPVKKAHEALDFIVSDVQTIGIEPQSLAFELRDELSKKGVLRISNVGHVDYPRFGVIHNGVSLTRLVRVVGMEREISHISKVYDVPDNFFDECETLYYKR